MSQTAVEWIALCFNPACPNPGNSFAKQICASCGTGLQLQDRYIAVRLLGQGGSGRTFLVVDQLQMPTVPYVVKQLWREHLCPEGAEPSRLLLQLDIQRLAQLGTHAQIPTLLNSFEQEGFFYVVHEYMAGNNLAIELTQRGALSPAEIWTILSSLLPVLQYVHAQGIIHRDIKPENVMLRGHQVIPSALALVDFSAAQWVTPTSSILLGTTVGSPEYAAPEQLAGKAVFASDLYSLGVTCLHLLTGIRPLNLFDVAGDRWAWRDYWWPNQIREHNDLAEILDQLIEPALSKRFASAESVIAAMPKTWRQKISIMPPIPAPRWECYATLSGHNGLFASINAVAISPDSNTLASASDDQTVRIWDVKTGKETAVLRGHEKSVKAIAFHPHTQSLLASGGRDRIIQIWNLAAHRPTHTLIGHQHQINSLAFSPDGHTLASGSADKTIKLWDFAMGETIATLTGHRLAVNTVTFSPRHPVLVSASADSTVKVWDLTRFELIHSLVKHTASVGAVAFSPNDDILATGGEDRTICLWDAVSWQFIRTLSGHPWSVSALTFSTDGTLLLSGSWDKTVKGWHVSTGKECATLSGHTDSVTCIAISPNSGVIASGSQDKTIKLWKSIK